MSTATTIDITNTVESLRSVFVDWAVGYVYGTELALPGMEWVSLPIISDIDKELIRLVLDSVSKSTVMQGFFLNTALRKSSQAQDFVNAVTARTSLPPTTSEADYAKAEQAQMAAFRSFVVLGN